MKAIHSNQDGMVLVLVLIVLLASTLIGVAAIRGAATDIRIAGNDARFTTSLYQAEANINTVLCNTRSWIDEPTGSASKTYQVRVDSDGKPIFSKTGTKNITIVSQGRGQPPRGSGYSVTSFEAGYFEITSVQGNAQVVAGAWMVFPKVK